MGVVFAGTLILITVTILVLALRPPNAYVRGKQGEIIVQGALRLLDPLEYDVFHDIIVPCTSTASGICQIDHIVVGPSAIFVIETKNIQGALHGKRREVYWTHVVGMQKRRIYAPHRQNAAHIKTLRRAFPDLPKDVWFSLIAVPNSLQLYIEEISGAYIVQFSHLVDFITRSNASVPQPLSPAQREYVIRTLLQWKRRRAIKHSWLGRIGRRKRDLGNSLDVASGRCPVCGSPLQVVKDANGSKMVCTKPSCTFSTTVLSITALRQPKDHTKT
ncbi:Nuclease-related domain-containing protein [Sulfobacillus thermosulfidooxidans DSM 9293]|uniref:Nuclease-related domain-containing protein n=2 Tax=Sulfobacillus thermosulfidooxidans TaxID=28034 RepID=A0A1W1WE84_SULTA|nr:NERD domain-containing protein [Sulfobacillus thermosulfidooxidans]PSR29555.1 MAG: NERD domain-containing protein [Sulfobacillus thermosulfidooxidans]SMC04033.1 Nuclease-related domain-containing protein [Sulfobacillus thermosulfidooxidans DSM 9293]